MFQAYQHARYTVALLDLAHLVGVHHAVIGR